MATCGIGFRKRRAGRVAGTGLLSVVIAVAVGVGVAVAVWESASPPIRGGISTGQLSITLDSDTWTDDDGTAINLSCGQGVVAVREDYIAIVSGANLAAQLTVDWRAADPSADPGLAPTANSGGTFSVSAVDVADPGNPIDLGGGVIGTSLQSDTMLSGADQDSRTYLITIDYAMNTGDCTSFAATRLLVPERIVTLQQVRHAV